MKTTNLLWLGLSLLTVGTPYPEASAQDTARFQVHSSTIDGGGTSISSGGRFALAGTIGQPDAGLMQGGVYTLGGGFWSAGGLHVVQALSSLAAQALVLLLCFSFTARAIRRRRRRSPR